MSVLAVLVQAFDPAVPFKAVEITPAGIDTWHEYCLITQELLSKLPMVQPKREETLRLSGGMSIEVPLVEIGLRIGSIRLERVECLVVGKGNYDVLLGSEAVERAFQLGRDTRVASP